MDYTYDNPDCLWIHPDVPGDGVGTFEQPFSTLEAALARVKPGQAIVLQGGNYDGDCNIQVSGTAARPIRIVALPGAEVTVRSACWFFYDTSDLIVEGITFVDAPRCAISVVGTCNRNRFEGLRFINCSARKEAACTLYIGGAGGECTIVENCTFTRTAVGKSDSSPEDASIGLMIAQGDMEHDNPIVHCLVRSNRIENYAYGIVVGGDESRSVRCGHIVEYNTVVNSSREGILVKSADTQIRSNIVREGSGTALSCRSMLDGIVMDNRVVDCGRGIYVHGAGHSVTGNCLVRCSDGAVRVGGISQEYAGTTTNCFIESNTFIDCRSKNEGGSSAVSGVLFDKGTTGIIQNNLFSGAGRPYAVVDIVLPEPESEAPGEPVFATQFVIRDNLATGGCQATDGVGASAVSFDDTAEDDYSNPSGCGATGWSLKPQGFNPAVDAEDEEGVYRAASVLEDEQGNPVIPGSEAAGEEERLFGNYYNEMSDDDDDQEDEVYSDNDGEEW
jgi:hypothetical protein